MRKSLLGMGAAVCVLALAAPLHAGKGGGKGPPGGGGGGGGSDPPADPEIAYVANGDLMVMNADGSNRTVVLAGSDHRLPTWSPDGQTLLFASDVQGPGLYTVELDGSGLTKVVAIASGSLGRGAWSPVPLGDGEYKIAFSDQVVDADGTFGEFDVFLVNTDGTGLVNVTRTPDRSESFPTWSPDASRLACTEIGPTPDGVAEDIVVRTLDADLSVTAIVNLTDESGAPGGPLNDAAVLYPAWERSGDRISVSVQLDGGRDLWLIHVSDPANPERITDGTSVHEDLSSWSPSGDRVICQAWAQRGNDGGLYVIDLNTLASQQILPLKQGGGPSWRP